MVGATEILGTIKRISTFEELDGQSVEMYSQPDTQPESERKEPSIMSMMKRVFYKTKSMGGF